MIYIATDPGIEGAIALMEYTSMSGHRCLQCFDLPVFDRVVVKSVPIPLSTYYESHQNDHSSLEAFKKYLKKKRIRIVTVVDYLKLNEMFEEVKGFNPECLFLEYLWARPNDSAMTAFSMGGGFDAIQSQAYSHGLGDKLYLVPPSTWKQWKPYQRFSLWGSGKSGKQIAIDTFQEIFPDSWEERLCPLRKGSTTRRNKPRDGRADAALIGLYGACELMDLPLPIALAKPRSLVNAAGICELF